MHDDLIADVQALEPDRRNGSGVEGKHCQNTSLTRVESRVQRIVNPQIFRDDCGILRRYGSNRFGVGELQGLRNILGARARKGFNYTALMTLRQVPSKRSEVALP